MFAAKEIVQEVLVKAFSKRSLLNAFTEHRNDAVWRLAKCNSDTGVRFRANAAGKLRTDRK